MPTALARAVVIARTAALHVEYRELTAYRSALRDDDMRRFFTGRSPRLPGFLRGRLLARLGAYATALPDEHRRNWSPDEECDDVQFVV